MTGSNTLDNEFRVRAIDDLSVGARKSSADILDKLRSRQERVLRGAEFGKAGLVSLPEGDLSDVAVGVLFEAGAEPVGGAVRFV